MEHNQKVSDSPEQTYSTGPWESCLGRRSKHAWRLRPVIENLTFHIFCKAEILPPALCECNEFQLPQYSGELSIDLATYTEIAKYFNRFTIAPKGLFRLSCYIYQRGTRYLSQLL
jgi:hypothetical protein